MEFVDSFERDEPYGTVSDAEVASKMPTTDGEGDPDSKTLLTQSLLADDQTFDHLRRILALTKTRVKLDLSRETRESGVCGCSSYELKLHGYESLRNKLTADWGVSPEDAVAYAETYADYYVDTMDAVEVLDTLASFDDEDIRTLVDRIVLPNERRQQAAKLRGHEAERKVAKPLLDAGVTVLPEDKRVNPRSGDIQLTVDGYEQVDSGHGDTVDSYDLLVRDDSTHVIGIVGMVHTSILGQYGSDKADTVERRANNVERYNEEEDANMELWALVDGAGFTENDYLEDVYKHVDGFFQIQTAFKLWVRLHQRDLVEIEAINFDDDVYDDDELAHLREWASDVDVPTDTDTHGERYEAGNAELAIEPAE
jgi:hypothetical protein